MSISCECDNYEIVYNRTSYNQHLSTEMHISFMKKLYEKLDDDQFSLLFNYMTINCLCGERYDFKEMYHHSTSSAQHKQWKSANPDRDNDVIQVCYCGRAYKTQNFDQHKKTCSRREQAMQLYRSKN